MLYPHLSIHSMSNYSWKSGTVITILYCRVTAHQILNTMIYLSAAGMALCQIWKLSNEKLYNIYVIARGLIRSPHWGQLGECHRGLEELVLLGTLWGFAMNCPRLVSSGCSAEDPVLCPVLITTPLCFSAAFFWILEGREERFLATDKSTAC